MRYSITVACLTLFIVQSATAQIVPFTVYPGDTNNDSIVSVHDLLPIGIAYENETLPRIEPVSTLWAPQASEGFLPNVLPVTAINFAHIDADGNGFIDTLDSDIIAMNYDSMVVDGLVRTYQPMEPAVPEPFYCPFIRLEFDRDTALINDTMFLDFFIDGLPFTGVDEPNGVLGAAFSLDFDPLNIADSLIQIYPDTLQEDLFFVHATFNTAGIARQLPRGRIDFGAAGYGTNAIRQPRHLGTAAIIVEDMIFRFGDAVPFFVNVDPASVLILNRDEQWFLPDCPSIGDEVILYDPITSTTSPEFVQKWRIFPNPSPGYISIFGTEPIEQLSVFDMQGRLLQTMDHPVLDQALDFDNFSNGVYTIHLLSNGFVQAIRLITLE